MRIHHGEKDGIGITPITIIDECERHVGRQYTIDGCASPEHARLRRYITPEEDFITTARDFTGEAVWLNPPYRKTRDDRGYTTRDFVRRASELPARFEGCLVSVLLESNMSGTTYFSDYIGKSECDRRARRADLYFFRGRIEFFENASGNTKSSMLITFS